MLRPAMVEVFDGRACLLGEGPLWHPMRQQLFWFDIMGKRLLTRTADGPQHWPFDRHVSAAGWIDTDTLLIATETDLIRFDLRQGQGERVMPLEDDTPATRSNDGRADPQGGFWIGTMGKHAEPGAGALYRFHRGELRQIRDGVTIPNATCFAPDGRSAYFADTAAHLVWRYDLDADGWPMGEPAIYLDHRASGLNPDGAVVDANGTFWCAEWGAGRVAGYDGDGRLVDEIILPASQPTCPAFGGDDLQTLYVTSARQGLPQDRLTQEVCAGQTFAIPMTVPGQAEHRVIL